MRSPDDLQREAELRERTERCVVPIYTGEGLGKREHWGSAVLVKAGDKHCLVSAAHVIAACKHGPLIMPGRPYFRLNGMVYSTSELSPDMAAHDPIDLAFLWLEPGQVKSAEAHGSIFFDLEDGNVDDRTEDMGAAKCVAIGFHEDAVQMVPGKNESWFAATVLISELATEERMTKHGFLPRTHIGVPFEGRVYDSLDRRILRVRPPGMSGGGVWIHSKGKYRLGGIIIEFYASKSLLIATRMIQLADLLAAPRHVSVLL